METTEEYCFIPNSRKIPTHRRVSSQTVPSSFCSSPVDNFAQIEPESFDNFELNLLKKSRLIGLAVPYKILAKKIDSVSLKTKALACIKVPLIKKLPFGKHCTQVIEPKFHNVLHSNRSVFLTEKKVKRIKLLSGRLK